MFFVTNNSTKSRAGYKKKFDSLGLDIPAEEIFSSSFAAAAYLEQTKFKETKKKVYIIGEVGICDELDLIDIPWIGGPDDKGKVCLITEILLSYFFLFSIFIYLNIRHSFMGKFVIFKS